MFLILVGGLARCLAEWVFTVSDYRTVIARGQSLGKTQDARCTVAIVTNQGVSEE
jgi:hypothetical protein